MGPAKNGNTDQTGDSIASQAFRGLLVFAVPLAGIFGTYYSTRAGIESDIRQINTQLEYINRDLDAIRHELDRHVDMGSGGIPHPTSSSVAIDRLEVRLKRLEDKVMP